MSSFGNSDLLERVHHFLREHPEGVPSTEIARRFLHVQDPRPSSAGPVVDSLLGGDPRFSLIGTQMWAAAPDETPSGSAGSGEGALLFGVARRSETDPRAYLYAFLRTQEGVESGSLVFVRRLGAADTPPARLADLARGARLVVFYSRAPFRALEEPARVFFVSTLRLRAWASGFLEGKEVRTPALLAARLGLPVKEGEDPLLEARLLRAIHERLLETRGLPPADTDRAASREVPFLREGGEELLADLPDRPGVYRMHGRTGELLYIGKSRSLRSRVESYFTGFSGLSDDKKELVRRIAEIEVDVLGSEAEALLHEWRSIRKKRPPYNEKVEVRAEPSPVVRGKNLVLFLPSTDERTATLFLLRADGAMRRLSARRNAKRLNRLRDALLGFFRGEGGIREPGAYALLSRWIEEERDRVTLVDVARHPDPGDLLRVVRDCLHDPDVASGKRIDPI
ncbi:MAG: nucleotide excision repair endonuclease [Candidatus Eisenbacteria bacterium]